METCRVGLICLTRENLTFPWLLVEAGALAKTLHQTFVCPYLLDLQFADIQPPLAQFQLTRAEKDDTRRLLHTINRAVAEVASEQALSEGRLEMTIEKWWPDLERTLHHIPPASSAVPARRPEYELLAEILQGVRGLTRWFESANRQEKAAAERVRERGDAVYPTACLYPASLTLVPLYLLAPST